MICSRNRVLASTRANEYFEIATKLVVEKPGTQKIQGPVHLDEGIRSLLVAEHDQIRPPSGVPAPGRRLADHAAWSMFPVVPALTEHGRGLGAYGLYTFPLGASIRSGRSAKHHHTPRAA